MEYEIRITYWNLYSGHKTVLYNSFNDARFGIRYNAREAWETESMEVIPKFNLKADNINELENKWEEFEQFLNKED